MRTKVLNGDIDSGTIGHCDIRYGSIFIFIICFKEIKEHTRTYFVSLHDEILLTSDALELIYYLSGFYIIH